MIVTILLGPPVIVDAVLDGPFGPRAPPLVDIINDGAHPVPMVLETRSTIPILAPFQRAVLMMVGPVSPSKVVDVDVATLAVSAYHVGRLSEVDDTLVDAVTGDAADLVGLVSADDSTVTVDGRVRELAEV